MNQAPEGPPSAGGGAAGGGASGQDPFGGGGGPGGGSFDPDEGNFKKGRVGPAAILIGIALVAGAVGVGYMALRTHATTMTVEQIVATKKNIYVLPKADQLPRWRELAKSEESALAQEAIAQLAYAGDPEGIALATAALSRGDHKVRGLAAQALAYYGSPLADSAKASLMKALAEANDSDKPQIVWALVTLKEPGAMKAALAEYRAGHLSKVERLGGGPAFDPEMISGLVSLDELAKLADDPAAAVRQLVALVLSRAADAKYTQTLIKLVKDQDLEVRRAAASGLGKIGDETARAPLLAALADASKEDRSRFLEALRDGIGGPGLVLALDSVKKDPPETTWFQTKQIFEMLREIADPRVGDALLAWVEKSKPLSHWRCEAGTRLAEVGDVRGAKLLGERMMLDPTKLYNKAQFWEADEGGHLSQTVLPRGVAARMLADLAVLYPDKADELKAAAEDQVIFWVKDKPEPQANGLRFLATVKSQKIMKDLRDWAFPKAELPKEGQLPPFPTEFGVAQSALRYLGRAGDKASFDKIVDQFKRKKDAKMDITQSGLEGSGLSLMGMSLRALGVGAADALSEFGDPKAVKPLMEFIEQETWHEEAREAACSALAFSADDKAIAEIAKKVREFGTKEGDKKQFIAGCYATSLSIRPFASALPTLVDLVTNEVNNTVRLKVARAIGAVPIDAAAEAKLFAKLKDPDLRNAAALALVLGGTPDVAARTIAMYADFDRTALEALKDDYFRAFGYWSDQDLANKNLYRWVENAEAVARIKVGDAPQEWARQRLQSQFDNLRFDNGPHSETRVVLRNRLIAAAKGQDDAARKGAIATLKFMKERGPLMALRNEKGDVAALAKRAYFELTNPKVLEAEDLSKLQPKQKQEPGTVNVRAPK